MFAVLTWVALSIVVGYAANQKGRSGGGFFLLSLLLSPLIGILVVIAVPRVERTKGPLQEHVGQKKCPSCAEWILIDAKKCKHCGEAQSEPSPQQLLAAAPAATGSHGSAFPWLVLVLMAAIAIWALSSERARAQPMITDGDTLKLNGTTYRLWGIDAPETKQDCPDGWPAGRLATTHLQALIAGRNVVCERRDTDRYGRTVAVCRAGGEDLGAIMVRDGYAWAFVRYSGDYVGQEARAKAGGSGVHGHGCAPAWEWRAAQRR